MELHDGMSSLIRTNLLERAHKEDVKEHIAKDNPWWKGGWEFIESGKVFYKIRIHVNGTGAYLSYADAETRDSDYTSLAMALHREAK